MAYDKKFKKRVVEFHEKGNTTRKTAETFGISRVSLNEWIKQYRNQGEFTRKKRVYPCKINEEALVTYLKENPDAYLSEIAEHFNCGRTTVWDTLKRLNITRKKR